jgi:hypothetical protein
MRVLVWAAVAVVAFAGAAAAEEFQMAVEGEERELSPCSGRRLGEPEEVTEGRELMSCKSIKCSIKCNKKAGCAWASGKCGKATPG